MPRSRTPLTAALVLFVAAPVFAHGGSFRGPSGGVPPGLPSQPSKPGETGGSTHSWLTWWGYNQFKYTDFRRRQVERRGPISGAKRHRNDVEEDPNAWRADVRSRLTPLMLEALKDHDEEVRTAAAVALGKWRVHLAIPELKKLYQRDDVRQVREAGVLGLMLMRDPTLRDWFIQLAEQRDDKAEKFRVRGYALLGLGLIGDEAARSYLLALLDPKNKKARRNLPKKEKHRRELLVAAVASLTQVEGVDLSQDFLRIAQDKRLPEQVRAYAVSAIGKTGAKRHLPVLLEMARKDRSYHMRRSAVVALGALATRTDSEVIEELGKRLKRDDDKIVRHFAALNLGIIGGPKAFQILRRSYGDANKEARGFFLLAYGLCKEPVAADLLAEHVKAFKDPMDAAAACLALGLFEDSERTPVVRRQFDQAKAWTLMQTCMLSLGILNDQSSANKVKEILLTKRQPAVRTSAAVSYALLRQWSALPVLIDLLHEARSIVTLSALAQVMGFLSSPQAVDPLVKMYEDRKLQRQARAFALVSLGALGDPEDFPVLVRMAWDINYLLRSDPLDEALTIL
ncbi:MAG: HEAT repeat domain-containing protein [Planctomycetota bacterium]|jgi:HEAT repeat protein